MGGLEAPAPRQAVRLRPGGFPEAQGRVSAALTGPGRMAVGWSPADNQQLPPRHLDQGCALPRTGGEAGGGSLCPLYRQGAPPPTPSGAESKQGLRGLRPEGEGLCPPSFREGPSESATFPPVCDGWGWGGVWGSTERQARSSRRTPALPHRSRPRQVQAPAPYVLLGEAVPL